MAQKWLGEWCFPTAVAFLAGVPYDRVKRLIALQRKRPGPVVAVFSREALRALRTLGFGARKVPFKGGCVKDLCTLPPGRYMCVDGDHAFAYVRERVYDNHGSRPRRLDIWPAWQDEPVCTVWRITRSKKSRRRALRRTTYASRNGRRPRK